ncbi:hypothetical protein ACWC09_18160 [Streptomyces sp. NPDC001617]
MSADRQEGAHARGLFPGHLSGADALDGESAEQVVAGTAFLLVQQPHEVVGQSLAGGDHLIVGRVRVHDGRGVVLEDIAIGTRDTEQFADHQRGQW